MTSPRSFTNLHRAGRSAKRKIAFCRRHKRDVALRTRRRQTCRLPVTATTDFLAADILNRRDRAYPAIALTPQRPLTTDCGGTAILRRAPPLMSPLDDKAATGQ